MRPCRACLLLYSKSEPESLDCCTWTLQMIKTVQEEKACQLKRLKNATKTWKKWGLCRKNQVRICRTVGCVPGPDPSSRTSSPRGPTGRSSKFLMKTRIKGDHIQSNTNCGDSSCIYMTFRMTPNLNITKKRIMETSKLGRNLWNVSEQFYHS